MDDILERRHAELYAWRRADNIRRWIEDNDVSPQDAADAIQNMESMLSKARALYDVELDAALGERKVNNGH